MLPKRNRLKKEKDFERVFKKGKGLEEGFLFIKVAKNDLEMSRFGFVVSEKVSKKATLRNKVKRKLRELTRARLSRIKIGLDVALVARPGIEQKNSQEIGNMMDRLFKKTGIYN